jgi:hypothetical protein
MTDIEEGWITTYTGKKFFPLNPNYLDIDIRDVAHALSNICRFSGHCPEFYSVAQHSVYVSQLVPLSSALWGLLHDASEAYLHDIARPVKHQPEFGIYRELEHKLMGAIIKRFLLPAIEPPVVTEADSLLLRAEAKSFKMLSCEWKHYDVRDIDWKIFPVLPKEAELMFLNRHREIEGLK